MLFFIAVLLLSFLAIVIFYQLTSDQRLNNLENKYNLRNNIINKNINNNPPLYENRKFNLSKNELIKETIKEIKP